MSVLKFSKSHEWARIENDIAVVGITDYAQKELGDIVFIELPRVDETVRQNAQFGTIESTKSASEMFAPLSGKVIEVNKDLPGNPQWVNESPFEKGWMIKIKIENSAEAAGLMDEEAYGEFVSKESHH
ncbi:MAG: glycine cleavage system protein GcvH [Candidatus Aureabacteria bacterium]|nr:glycine cleavage system protein GcvH [Candidatus Auribacterota bacterium]